jgi:hypothetical protein
VARPADWTPLGCAADPVPGDPQAVEQEAARLAQAGAAAGRESAGLRQVAAVAAGPELKGAFATQAAGAATKMSGEMSLVATRYAAVSRALDAWSSALGEAQRMSLRALDMAVGPYRLLQSAAGQAAGAGQSRAQGELDDARALLAKAVALRDQEAAQTARAIRAACNDKLADSNWKFGLPARLRAWSPHCWSRPRPEIPARRRSCWRCSGPAPTPGLPRRSAAGGRP